MTSTASISPQRPASCPCCSQPVRVPTLEIIVNLHSLTPLEARVLGAIWRGRGMPVVADRLFDAIYLDDPDGGPPPTQQYLALKVALSHIRRKLRGSGISIEHEGYKLGWKLAFGSAYETVEWGSRR